MKKGLTVVSLFDGKSGGRLGLERAGYKVDKYYASEIKPHALKVVEDNYPDTIKLGDVTKVRYENGVLYSENGEFNVGEIDIVIGGSPCQDFSIANYKKRQGLNGTKSGLFFHYLRILEEIKPKWFMLENVASMDKESRAQLDDYMKVKSIKIDSELVCAQIRKRLYWTNIPQTELIKKRDILIHEILDYGYSNRNKSRTLTENMSRPNVVPVKMYHRYVSTGFTTLIFESQNHYESCKSHYDTYFKGLSAKEIDELIESKGLDLSVYNGLRYMNQRELERCQTVPEGYTKSISRNEAASLLGDGWTIDVIAHIFSGLPNTYKL